MCCVLWVYCDDMLVFSDLPLFWLLSPLLFIGQDLLTHREPQIPFAMASHHHAQCFGITPWWYYLETTTPFMNLVVPFGYLV
jgi:hypothetical protein